MNRASYVQKILESRPTKKSMLARVMSLPSSFEVPLYFLPLMSLLDLMQKKLMSTLHNYNSFMHEA